MNHTRSITTLIVCAGFLAISLNAQAQSKAYDFKIEATDVGSALNVLAAQTQYPLLFDFNQVKSIRMNAVEGRYTLQEALNLILKDTSLTGRLSEKGVISISFNPQSEVLREEQAMNVNKKTKALASSASAALITAIASTTASAQAPVSDAEIIVTGTRSNTNRTALETAVPVDVFNIGDLTSTGRTELNQILAATVPSFNFNQTAINDGSDIVRPATLRGLGPDQTLVLVNSKRRHTSALLNLNAGGRGSAAVDLNAIPSAAIGSVQVLRDGASAQYGSDAIAGVINIILRDDATGGGASAQYGAFATDIPADGRGKEWDGETVVLTGWKGFALGDGGHLTLSAEYKDRSTLNRAGADPRNQFRNDLDGNIIDAGSARENTFDRINHIYGAAPSNDLSLFANAALPITEAAEIYGWAGFQDRRGRSPGFFRRSSDASLTRTPRRNLTEIFPNGFLPTIVGDLTDFSLGGGIKGEVSDWQYDVSGVFGTNELDYSVENTLNASLGPNSPTEFDAGALQFDQLTFNAEAVRQFGNVSFAIGAEYRDETYEITAGEEGSFSQGGYRGIPGVNYIAEIGVNVPDNFDPDDPTTFPDPFDANFGVSFAGGSQVFSGFTPQSALTESRDTIGLFVDVEWEPAENILIAGALRYEDYSDFGDILTGKISGRYDFTDNVGVRAAFSTGFRAPSVHQQFFTSTATVFVDGDPIETGTFPADSAIANALGSEALEPEESTNYSAGIVVQLDNGIYATIDGYKIDIDDRIVLTENLNGAAVQAVLSANNVQAGSARFFINGVDTETQGLDVILGYKGDIPWGRLDLSAALNLTDTDVTRVPENTEIPGLTLFSTSNTISFEQGAPTHKLVVNTNLATEGGHVFNARATSYGGVTIGSNNPNNVFDLEGKVIFDASATFRVTDNINFGGGMDNIFDTYPSDPSEAASGTFTGGIFPFSSRSPFGFSGRFVYAKASYNF